MQIKTDKKKMQRKDHNEFILQQSASRGIHPKQINNKLENSFLNNKDNYPQFFQEIMNSLFIFYGLLGNSPNLRRSKNAVDSKQQINFEQYVQFCRDFDLAELPNIDYSRLVAIHQEFSTSQQRMNRNQFEAILNQISLTSFGNSRGESNKNNNQRRAASIDQKSIPQKKPTHMIVLFKYMGISTEEELQRKLAAFQAPSPRNSNQQKTNFLKQQSEDDDLVLDRYFKDKRSLSMGKLQLSPNMNPFDKNSPESSQLRNQSNSHGYAQIYRKKNAVNSDLIAKKNQFQANVGTLKLSQVVEKARKEMKQTNKASKLNFPAYGSLHLEPIKMNQIESPENFIIELLVNNLRQSKNDLQVPKDIQVPKEIQIQKQPPKKDTNSKKEAHSQNEQPLQETKETKLHLSIQEIRDNILGFNTKYTSPFQMDMQSVYVDHTATNRPYRGIQNMIQFAKKTIANPHTEFSHYGKFSTDLMHYAQDSLLTSFGVKSDKYVALPAGSGSTGAIEKATKILKIIEETEQIKPTVFLTSYEHHSNILPWVQFYDDVKILAHDQNGNLLFQEVEKQLKEYPAKKLIVTVSAASNVTSQITQLLKLNEVIKRVKTVKDVVFCTDCAAFCCHHDLNLALYDQIDFAYLSPHKNLGGSESCGVLVLKKSACAMTKPTFPGGGTVNFVRGFSKEDVLYDQNIFAREIAGTPPFLGYYRAALSFELLHTIGYDVIHERQVKNTVLFLNRITEGNNKMKEEGMDTVIEVYGDQQLGNRANVISFNIQYAENDFVHYSFASLLFTDIFGIQLRSGCFCAGPFGIEMLTMNRKVLDQIQAEVRMGIVYRKPGYIRLDLTFYLELYQIEYVAEACVQIARKWRNMQKFYTICSNGEIIRHLCTKEKTPVTLSLQSLRGVQENLYKNQETTHREESLAKQLARGSDLLNDPMAFIKKHKISCGISDKH